MLEISCRILYILIGIIASLIAIIISLGIIYSKKRRLSIETEANLKRKIVDIKESCEKDKERLRTECENEKKKMKDKCNSEKIKIEKDCEEKIRKNLEEIENRKEILEKMDDKNLLISIVLALDGYGRKFSRIEDFLRENVENKIDNISTEMNIKIEKTQKEYMHQIITIGESITEENKTLLNGMKSIKSDIMDTIDDIESTVDSMESTVNSIYSSVCHESSFYSLDSRISSIKDSVEEIKSEINSLSSND